MNRNKNIIVILLLAITCILLYNNCTRKAQSSAAQQSKEKQQPPAPSRSQKIDALTSEGIVISYIKANGKLPDYYITKKEARDNGWNAAEGNLCDVLPGKAIGGDVFTNREGNLPEKAGRRWFEADLNYNCGRRNADRLLFSSDGLIFVTRDHYKTFEEK